MDIDKLLRNELSQALQKLFQVSLEADTLVLQPTRKEFLGTHTFVTFPVAKQASKSPQEIAEGLGVYMKESSKLVSDYQVVKGFLNLVVKNSVWLDKLKSIGGSRQWGQGAKNEKLAVIEISSPNTNKPLHLGHLRNICLGFSVSNILEMAGYQVKKVCIVNDRGIHICKSMVAYEKFGDGSSPQELNLKGDHFVGDFYVKFDKKFKQEVAGLVAAGSNPKEAAQKAPVAMEAQNMLKRWEAQDSKTIALWNKMNAWVYQGFDETYSTIGASFDKIYYESNTYVLGKDMVNEGLDKGIFYRKDDQSVWVDLTDQGLDEKLILRADGTSVYMTQDLGTADLRYADFRFDKSVYVVGNEQDYHFEVLIKILKKLGRPYADGMYHLSYGMVDLPSGKMKSREGTVVDADMIMAEMIQTAQKHTLELGKIEGLSEEEASMLYRTLGLGALKYYLTKVDPRKRMLFNPEESIAFQGDTGPFIQYTHARISAILRKANSLGLKFEFNADEINDLHSSEQSLIHLIDQFPSKIQLSASEYAPSVIAQYIYELAKEYNRFYAEVSIFNESDQNLRQFRVMLSEQTAKTVSSGMGLLGIDVPERM